MSADTLTADVLAGLGAFFRAQGTTVAGYGISAIVSTVSATVLLIYFLVSGRRIAAGVFWFVPPEYRYEVDAAAAKILPVLWRYFAGLVAIVAYTTTVSWVCLGPVLHLSHVILLAIVVVLLELIPVIGPAVSIGIVGLAAIQQSSLITILGVTIFTVALRISISQFFGPLVLGQAARVHPVASFSRSCRTPCCLGSSGALPNRPG